MAKDTSLNNFGLLIAYVIPGLVLLWGVRRFVPGVDLLLGTPLGSTPSVGGFLYATLAAIGVGFVVSTIRWMVIDSLHHATGITPPAWDFARLRESPEAFDLVVEHYYRYYQAHANGVISLLIIFTVRRWELGIGIGSFGVIDLGLLALMAVLFVGSRDSLRRYYARGGALLRAKQKSSTRRTKRQALQPAGGEDGA